MWRWWGVSVKIYLMITYFSYKDLPRLSSQLKFEFWCSQLGKLRPKQKTEQMNLHKIPKSSSATYLAWFDSPRNNCSTFVSIWSIVQRIMAQRRNLLTLWHSGPCRTSSICSLSCILMRRNWIAIRFWAWSCVAYLLGGSSRIWGFHTAFGPAFESWWVQLGRGRRRWPGR